MHPPIRCRWRLYATLYAQRRWRAISTNNVILCYSALRICLVGLLIKLNNTLVLHT